MALTPVLARGKTGTAAINAAMEDLQTLDGFTVATVPDAASNEGKMIYVSNGAAGSPCLAYSDGTNWLRVLLGAAVAAA